MWLKMLQSLYAMENSNIWECRICKKAGKTILCSSMTLDYIAKVEESKRGVKFLYCQKIRDIGFVIDNLQEGDILELGFVVMNNKNKYFEKCIDKKYGVISSLTKDNIQIALVDNI